MLMSEKATIFKNGRFFVAGRQLSRVSLVVYAAMNRRGDVEWNGKAGNARSAHSLAMGPAAKNRTVRQTLCNIKQHEIGCAFYTISVVVKSMCHVPSFSGV